MGKGEVEDKGEGWQTVLRDLRDQISSSAHSSVVQRHVEFQALGSSTSDNKKSVRLKSHWEFQGRD